MDCQNPIVEAIKYCNGLSDEMPGIRFIYSLIDTLLRGKMFNIINSGLEQIDINNLNPGLMLGILRITYPAKEKLPH